MDIEERIHKFAEEKILKDYQGKWLIDGNILCLEIDEKNSEYLYEIGEFAVIDDERVFHEQLKKDYLKKKHVLYLKNSFFAHSEDHDNYNIVFFVNRYFPQFSKNVLNILIELNLIKEINYLNLDSIHWTEYHYNIINDKNNDVINICNIASVKEHIGYQDNYNFHLLTGENNNINDSIFLESAQICFLDNFDIDINKENFQEIIKYVLLSIDCEEY